MTDEEIKALARKAGCPVTTDRDGVMTLQACGDDLRKFVTLVAERAAGAQPAPSVPEGWKLVPAEPTDEIARAGAQYAECGLPANAVFGYRAMLAAAPEAAKRKPLTYSDAVALIKKTRMAWAKHRPPFYDFEVALVSAVEAAHGIKENSND